MSNKHTASSGRGKSRRNNQPRRRNNNTDLCVDLKTRLRHDRIAVIGKNYPGVLRRDEECHYTFTEAANADKRNPRVFEGKCITVTCRDDGTLRPNFRPVTIGADFNAATYATDVANEILWALTSLLGK